MTFADSVPGGRIILDRGSNHPQKITLGEACQVGDVLGYSSGWKRALATSGSVIQGRLVALQSGKNGETIEASPNPTVSGIAGATAGGYIYVAEGSDYGKTTQTVPSTTGDANTIIGIALTATEVLFFLNTRDDSLAGTGTSIDPLTLDFSTLPTSDPSSAGKLWIAPDAKVVVSAG